MRNEKVYVVLVGNNESSWVDNVYMDLELAKARKDDLESKMIKPSVGIFERYVR